jgi:Uri superfamily endonuclease
VSDGGSYTLIVALDEAATVTAGALGDRDLPAGAYAYTGSALGPGGFARVDRHRRTARGDSDTRHWHVDYLLGHPAARIDRVVRSVGVDVECAVAERLPSGPVAGFGASDCDCPSHLAAGAGVDALADRALAAHEAAVAAGDDPGATVEVVAGDGTARTAGDAADAGQRS